LDLGTYQSAGYPRPAFWGKAFRLQGPAELFAVRKEMKGNKTERFHFITQGYRW
jgi:hypothetical protein